MASKPGFRARREGMGGGGGRGGSTLDGPTSGRAAGLTASIAMGALDLLPIVIGNPSYHVFPVTKHDLDVALDPVATYDGTEQESPAAQGETT